MRVLICFFFVTFLKVNAQDLKLVIPEGHTKTSLFSDGVSFSSDGKKLLTHAGDRTAKVWDVSTGRLRHTLTGFKNDITSSVFSLDGKLILVGCKDKTATLWDAVNGNLLMSIKTHDEVNSCFLSSDNKIVFTCSYNVTEAWDATTGLLIKTFEGAPADLSPDGERIAVCSEYNLNILEIQSGKLLSSMKEKKIFDFVSFNENGNSVLTNASDMEGSLPAKVWNVATSKMAFDLGKALWIKYSPKGDLILTGPRSLEDNSVNIWDAKTGKLIRNFKYKVTSYGSTEEFYPINAEIDPTSKFISVSYRQDVMVIFDLNSDVPKSKVPIDYGDTKIAFSPDGKLLANKSAVWETETGKLHSRLSGLTKSIETAFYSTKGDRFITTCRDRLAKIWDANSGQLLKTLKDSWIMFARMSPDGKKIITYSYNYLKIWDYESTTVIDSIKINGLEMNDAIFSTDGKLLALAIGEQLQLYDFTAKSLVWSKLDLDRINSLTFSSDGKWIATAANINAKVKIWEVASGQPIKTFPIRGDAIDVAFSPDNKRLVTSSNLGFGFTALWDISTGTEIYTFKHPLPVYASRFISEGVNIIASNETGKSQILETATGEIVQSINGEIHDVNNGHLLISQNSRILICDEKTKKEIISLISFSDSPDWVSLSPTGLFDATSKAMQKLYFIKGDDFIDFDQLKARYYEPGLWRKAMNNENLRPVTTFDSVELPPEIRVGQVDERGILPVEVINKGGGIGEVTFFINGKEVIKDLRKPGVDNKGASLSFSVPVNSYRELVPGSENFLTVKAWNAGQWIESRGGVVTYIPTSKSEVKPAIHIIICGVSDYTGNEIDLKYAAKDADNIADALFVGAKQLFGSDKTVLYKLTTTNKQSVSPTKENILKTFDKVSATAKSSDVILVYLSGHGINIGGADGDFYYLAQDAFTASPGAYSDPVIRKQSTISSSELVELFKKVPALKQVLMIDACASGRVVDNLISKRDIESSTLRALDRMKDRTGMHIITGCTADAVSYEASRYGQGVLTYSLLEGIRGAALREDQFVDVNKLFQYAQDRVPALATGIGGIQTPMVFSPNGSQSFDIGQLTETEKKEIPISKIRSVYVQSNFQDEEEMSDNLGLGKKVDQLLSESAAKGSEAPLIFVPVRDYPEGCQLFGRYKKENGRITLKLKKKCDGRTVSIEIMSLDIIELSKKIFNFSSE